MNEPFAESLTAAPRADKIPHSVSIHNHVIEDPYAWLRERASKRVTDHLQAENNYTHSLMKHTQTFQDKLYQEILGRIKETDLSVPVKIDDYFYYTRTEQGKQYPISCRKKGSLNATEEMILDMNALAEGHSYFSLGTFRISPDHAWLAYSTDTSGEETYTLAIKNLRAGTLLPETIPNCATSCEWAADNQTLFYTVLNDAKRPFKVFRHELRSDPRVDQEIYHDPDEAFIVSLSKSKSRSYLFLESHSSTTSEIRILRADQPYEPFQLFRARELHVEYDVEHHENRFLILTNDQAQNFKLMETPVNRWEKAAWTELIAHRPQIKLEGIEVFKDHIVLYEREQGLIKIRVSDGLLQNPHYVEFPESVYTAWGGNNPDYGAHELRFGYTSLITPSSVYDYDFTSRTRILRKQSEVLGGYDSSQYETIRLYAPSHDNTQVPISLVYRKGMKRNADNPLMLYGYGSYGISIDPEFSSIRLSLLNRGFIFAIAHVRGGGDLGRPWYDAGKLLHKKNTFLDFIACAEFLIREQLTRPEKLVISGGSAGGLLMGAVSNMRPDLFHGVVAHVPFVDVVNTMLDETLPLTVGEYEEWGNPKDPKYFDYILSYSPYDNVAAQSYPYMLITTGLNDPRVQYWEPVKWAAKLRDFKLDSRPVLVKINMGAGHGGASGRYDQLHEIAFDYAFILNLFGIHE